MKIATVIPKYGLVGGAEAFAYELTERLAQREGFQIHVFANQWRQEKSTIAFHKVPVLKFPRFLRQISFGYFSNERIRLQDYDLIHSHDRIFWMDVLTMHSIPHKTWIKEVRHKRPSLFDRSMAWVEKKGLYGPPTPMLMPVSYLVKDELLKYYDIPESKIRVVHPAVSLERFSTSRKEKFRHEIRQMHRLSGDDIVVLFVGMNFEVKRLDLIMRGISDLRRKGRNFRQVKLMVVGKGNQEHYRRLAYDLDIGERVIFVDVTREVEKYFLASDIFAMPSVFDTFGIAVLEAMAAGLPVIITRSVGACDLVKQGVQGFILREKPSPSEFGENLLVLLNKENRIKMGEEARRVALRHTWDHTADQVADVYRHCLMEKVSSQEKKPEAH